ncbi:MAG: 2-amino-4-hydroxy-6-hydroxymethyldihydropteridine diphosphokinase [Actinomycetota bacterium]
MLTAILGLGSNIGDREAAIKEAVDRLNSTDRLTVSRVSSLYETTPADYAKQPDFLNAAVEVTTDLKPEELLAAVQEIEKEMGRIKTIDKGPRNIDIDILLYDIVEVRLPNLTVPHPRLTERAFALVPLLEVAPDAVTPIGIPVRRFLKGLDISGVKKINNRKSHPEEPACRQAGVATREPPRSASRAKRGI